MKTEKKYERVCEKLEQLNELAHELEWQMMYERKREKGG